MPAQKPQSTRSGREVAKSCSFDLHPRRSFE
jgi:hypothetical protein